MTPDFKTVEPFVHNFLKKNYWKVETLMDYEDAVSEAKLQFTRTILRLEKRNCAIENEKHLMSLFKTSWSNHFITLANKATKERFVTTSYSDDTQQLLLDQLCDDLNNLGELEVLLDDAPSEIKQILHLLLYSPMEIVDTIRAHFFTNREKSNVLLCRLLGKNPTTVNLVQKTLDYLN